MRGGWAEFAEGGACGCRAPCGEATLMQATQRGRWPQPRGRWPPRRGALGMPESARPLGEATQCPAILPGFSVTLSVPPVSSIKPVPSVPAQESALPSPSSLTLTVNALVAASNV